MRLLNVFIVCLKLAAIAVLGGCSETETHEPAMLVVTETLDVRPVEVTPVVETKPISPDDFTAPEPPRLPDPVKEIVDTASRPQACRRNADGTWTCGPQRSMSSGSRSSSYCAPRLGPVRTILRRAFGR